MTPGIITFALVEIGTLFLVLSGIVLPWRSVFALGWSDIILYVGQTAVPSLCFFVMFYGGNLYNIRVARSLFEFRRRLFWPLVATFLSLTVLPPLVLPFKFAGSSPLSSLVTVLIGTCVVLPLRWGLYTFRHLSPFAERVLVLGTGELAWQVALAIRALSPVGYTIAGFVDDGGCESREASGRALSPVLGPLDRVEQIMERFRPDRIIVALRERRGRMPLPALLKAHWAGITVEDGIKVHERLSGKLAIESLTPGFLIFSTDFKKSPFDMGLRRTISLLIAIVGLIATAPLLVIIAIAIKLDSEGPVFFIQERAGLNRRVFHLVKFRTMFSLQPDGAADSAWDRDIESRVTRVGRWLRSTHLDELPQLFNILRGDMDLVGPRPEMTGNIGIMEKEIPYYTLRMSVRPGVTGWAQVRHGYAISKEDVTEKTRYDLYYIKHRSLWLDLRIILDTVKLVFDQRTATGNTIISEERYKPMNQELRGGFTTATSAAESEQTLSIPVVQESTLSIDSTRSSELS